MDEKPNPFESPRLEADAYTPNPSDGSLIRSVFAVLLGGVVVDWFATYLVNVAIAFALGFNSVGPTSVAMAFQSMWVRTLFMVCGVLCSFLGGLTAAWVARRRHVLHALLSVTVAHALVVPSFLFGAGVAQPLLTIFVLAICFVAAAFAGKILEPRNTVPIEET